MCLFDLAFASFIYLTTLSGCSSPFLPHNAVKYIPEFSHAETSDHIYPNEDFEHSYFSTESIRERYTQHIENYEANDGNPLLDIVRETIELMRQERKTDDELLKKETSSEKITAWKDADKTDILLASIQIMQWHDKTQEQITEMLTEKFGMTEEEAWILLEQALEENKR